MLILSFMHSGYPVHTIPFVMLSPEGTAWTVYLSMLRIPEGTGEGGESLTCPRSMNGESITGVPIPQRGQVRLSGPECLTAPDWVAVYLILLGTLTTHLGSFPFDILPYRNMSV